MTVIREPKGTVGRTRYPRAKAAASQVGNVNIPTPSTKDPWGLATFTVFIVVAGKWAKQHNAPSVTQGNKDPNQVTWKYAAGSVLYVIFMLTLQEINGDLAYAFAALILLSAFLDNVPAIAKSMGF